MESICECSFNLLDNNIVEGNALLENSLGEIAEIISNSNLDVLKCFQNVFKIKNLYKNVGGLIIIGILLFQIIFSVKFLLSEVNVIMRYLYDLTNSYIEFIKKEDKNIIEDKNIKKQNTKKYLVNKKNKIKYPPKKKNIKNKSNLINEDNYNKTINTLKSDSTRLNLKNNRKIGLSKKIGKNDYKNKNININININNKNNIIYNKPKTNSKLKINDNVQSNILNKSKSESKTCKINIEEYLEDDLDEMDFDNALKNDKRSFCQYYIHRIKVKQMIVNTFCSDDIIRPFPIKLLLLLLNIDLYFVINGLFFSEDYIMELYHLDKKDGFLDFIPRSIGRFFYATLVGVILDIIIGCLFIEENKIKRIYLRNKNDLLQMKYEISKINKSIRTRYKIFIFICIFISMISWYYVSCFNNVYSSVKLEWIKSSIVIIIIMQLLSCLIVLLEALLRHMSFEFKSEQIFKFKKFLS